MQLFGSSRICRPFAGRVRVHTCCECYNKRGYIRTWYVHQNFLFHFPFDEIYRRLLFFTSSGVLFPRESNIPQLNEKWNVLLVGHVRCFFFFFQLSRESYMVMDVVVQKPQKSSGYDQGTTMRKKHVSRDFKMCCCCCRFCCGAPTTDETIHAPVLHDASQIDYCRYWGRALLPPITSL